MQPILTMLDDALIAIDHSIGTNRRKDGLYHAYNLLELQPGAVAIDTLYPMLEGQVAALSSGAVTPDAAVEIVEALYASDIYRADQDSFMLYPDRELPGFLDKNRVPDRDVESIPLLQRMLDAGDERIVLRDADGTCRFSAEFRNVGDLNAELDRVMEEYGADAAAARGPLQALFEQVFNHKAFTGRSGTMFGYEGLGSVYWHMVSKLLLAVQENFFTALDQGADDAVTQKLGALYYRVRDGIGFNKTPLEYGAFPTDPYSHTPKHGGAKQPGMTGQVKEEVLSRFAELGVRVSSGSARFQPVLLRKREFVAASQELCFLDVDGKWQDLSVPAGGLAFTWCQVPIVYALDEQGPSLTVTLDDGSAEAYPTLELPAETASELFERSGRIRRIDVTFAVDMLLGS